MDAHAREILDLFIRWFHFVAGIMWIGNSMLFNWLDRNLLKREGLKGSSMGEIWLLHGGGFYQVEKKMLEQGDAYPDPLHWFMWQNFSTWASGILLLVVVYYLGGESFMVDPAVAKLGGGQAIALGAGSLLIGCSIYEGIWRSPLGKNTPVGAAVSFVCLIAYTYVMCHLLSGRAAFIHVGAMLGTCMTMNVWMHIVPSQRKLTEAVKKGEPVDPAPGYRAKNRSIHNNYMTFPVLFTMISNHYPMAFGSALNWLILLVVGLAAAGVRHFMNIRFWYGGWKPALAACAVAGVGGAGGADLARGSQGRDHGARGLLRGCAHREGALRHLPLRAPHRQRLHQRTVRAGAGHAGADQGRGGPHQAARRGHAVDAAGQQDRHDRRGARHAGRLDRGRRLAVGPASGSAWWRPGRAGRTPRAAWRPPRPRGW